LRWTWIGLLVALVTPTQAFASSCLSKPETQLPPERPLACVAEYQSAASVALVSVSEVPQPPCAWIQLRRSVDALLQVDSDKRAYPHDTCRSGGRSQRYEMTVIETFKGSPPSRFPAVLNGRYPASNRWMSAHRPDWLRFTVRDDGSYWTPGSALYGGHGTFPFLHAGALSDLTYVVQEGLCGDDYRLPVVGLAPTHLVFRDASGAITHWEPIDRGKPDVLLDRMRRMKAGRRVARPAIAPDRFFGGFDTVAVYDIRDCGDETKISGAGGQRLEPLDHTVLMAFVGSDHNRRGETSACSGQQRFLVLATGYANKPAYAERTWPKVQLVPVANGFVTVADIATQFDVTGPERIPVSQILAWTAASDPPWYDF